MENEKRIVYYDEDLHIEAYHFQGIMQRFPNHFHEHYVVGFIAGGRRHLTCKNEEYTTGTGDLILLNPMENHACEQIDEVPLDWRCLNIAPCQMSRIAQEITGSSVLPLFRPNVVRCGDLVPGLEEIHSMVMGQDKDGRKEELFYFFMEQLIGEYGEMRPGPPGVLRKELQSACDYMEANYMDNISLEQLSKVSGLNKYTLLRSFTLKRGITPYQYLSTIRVNKAKRLLEEGAALVDIAMLTGFSDQSHFTRFFKNFIGVTPKAYQSMLVREWSNTDGGRVNE